MSAATHPTPARARLPLAVHVLVHAAGILAVDQGYRLLVAHAPAGSGLDDPVGAGLVGFLILGTAAGLGGLVDGWFLDYGRLAIVWGTAAPLYAVASVVVGNFSYGGPDLSLVPGDLLTLVPFLTTIVVVPALLAAIGPWALSPRRQ